MMTDPDLVPDPAARAAWEPRGQYHEVHLEHPPEGATAAVAEFHETFHHAHWPTFLFASLLGYGGILLAWWIFMKRADKQWVKEGGVLDRYRTVLQRLYYVDDFYRKGPIALTMGVARTCLRFDKLVVDGFVNLWGVVTRVLAWIAGRVDANGVDGAVRGTGELAFAAGRSMRRLQTGRIQDYVGLTVAGMAVVFVLVMSWSTIFG
jgi:NADH:ubiquinone oxidoreductase subunit 5 (subunit L)/multisubunit Na+/H+ antiporter MnhA subunit